MGTGAAWLSFTPMCSSVRANARRAKRRVWVTAVKAGPIRVRATVANAILLANIAALVLLLRDVTASAQNGIFKFSPGRQCRANGSRRAPGSAYADPFSAWNLFRLATAASPSMDPSVAYCVRLCDGRFFPVQRHEGAAPEQTCSSFCPATGPKSTAAPASIRRSQRTAGATPT